MRRSKSIDYEEIIKESIHTSAVSLETIDNNKKYSKNKFTKQIFQPNDNVIIKNDIKKLNTYKLFTFKVDKIKQIKDSDKLDEETLLLIDQILRNLGLEKSKEIFFSDYEFFFSKPSYRTLILRNYLFIDHNKKNNQRYVNKIMQKQDSNYSGSEDIIFVNYICF